MRKLEIGPRLGKRIDNTWETLDVISDNNPNIIADIAEPLTMICDEVYDIIYASHVIEHVPWFKTIDCLKELYRILKPNGVIEIWVPDFQKLIAAYHDNELIKKDGWYKHNPAKDPMVWLNGRIFTYGPGEENWHKSVFTSTYLSDCLYAAGFKDISRLVTPRGPDHGYINLGLSGVKL